ncbi:MAG: DUF4434 domain-containing protein [Candidatus Latescibacteria bacterium]|nr:DUF4434 domain-containing protein [Candidatus Latescibacterota bacterium]
MTEPILQGSFFDLQHVNPWDAAYWTDECRFWGEASWRALVADMHGIGIRTIICITTALWGRPLFTGYNEKVGIPLKMGCEDPLTACVDEADRLGMEVFLGAGLRGRVSQVRDYADMKPPWPEDWFRWNTALAEALIDKYGDRACFAGLYIPYEMDFEAYQVELYEKLMKQWLRPAVGNVPFLASPGSLGNHPDPDRLGGQLERMDIDILACQDYGGRSNDVAEALELVKQNLAGLERAKRVVEQVGVRLWTNCEVFSRKWGPDGRPICIPGPFERIREQLRLQAPLVEKVICYQYQGIMNRRTERVPIGAPGTQALYDAYAVYLRERG